MDQMDIDHIVDVPDTPDRLTRQGINGKNGIEDENNHCPSTPHYSRQPNIFKEGSKDQPMIIDSGSRGLSMQPPKCTSNSINSRRPINSTASSFSSSSSSRNAHLFRKAVIEKNHSYPNHDSVNPHDVVKGFRRESNEWLAPTHNHHPRSVRPSCISRSFCHEDSLVDLTARNMQRPVMIGEMGNASGFGSSNDFREGVGFVGIQEKPGNGGFLSRDPIASPRVNKQKRLVRNGFISPNNVAKAKQLDGKDSNGSVSSAHNNNGSKPSSAPPISIDVKELVAEESDSYTRKGKGVVTHPCSSKEPDSKNKNLQSRSSIIFNEKAIGPSDYYRGAGKSNEESGGWRNTHSRTREMNISSPDEELHVIEGRGPLRYSRRHHGNRLERSENGIGVANGDNKGPELISSEHVYPRPLKESVSHHRTRLGRLNGSPSTANTLIKRQKQGSASSSRECSTAVSDDPEVVLLCSPSEAANSASTSRNVNNLEQIIEVDEFSPQLRRGAHDEDVRARQVEADELLARALQEELYNEMPGFGVGEVDEHMALTLQHQDDSNHGFPRAGHPILDARASRLPQSRSSSSAPRRGALARSAASGRMTRPRSRFPGQPRTLLSSRGRTSLFPEDMDVDMRMHILGAWEEFNEIGLSGGILQVPRDFNENDYEMLLALDDNNDQHSGASVRQINGLPQSTVQTENFEETCAVCLETPTIGETIRHLPCLHKFHKDCIDPWLRRRTCCPVCKSSVT